MCLLGSNIFLEPDYSTDIHVAKYKMSPRKYQLSNHIKKYNGTYVDANLWLSIEELRIYTFNKEQLFKKIGNTIFTLVNESDGKNAKKKYSLKVISFIGFYRDSNVANIKLPQEIKHENFFLVFKPYY